MLTRDLLQYRIRKGSIRPSFVSRDDRTLLEVAGRMVTTTERSIGVERKTIEDALRAEAGASKQPKIARGLAKLLLDRMDFGEAGEDAADLRRATFPTASSLLRSLPDDASFADYEARLTEEIGDLGVLRDGLFADLAEYRPLLSWAALDAAALLDRYNLALAQGLVLYAERLSITVNAPDLREVRRLLRWLKFCRLVAELDRGEEVWRLDVEGPAAILSMQKKYGLQLATFLGAVPMLASYEVMATVTMPNKRPATLTLSSEDPLETPHRGPPGHVPEEIEKFVAGFDDESWRLDVTPDVRAVGVADVAVPDFVLRRGDVSVAVELFHRWHRSSLIRRLDALAQKPDPTLILGVDRSLLDEELTRRVDGAEQVFLFSAFPSKRALKKVLERFAEL